ncbi:MAG: hypothetical protein M3Y87_05600, partial [Myxococcota bacterium]|nr:hypothetical protein [Myxococcota bacterium]
MALRGHPGRWLVGAIVLAVSGCYQAHGRDGDGAIDPSRDAGPPLPFDGAPLPFDGAPLPFDGAPLPFDG